MSTHDKMLRGVALVALALSARAGAAEGPSFNCARASSQVNKTICASSELSALDRQLAEHYRMLLAQSGADAPALQREEAQWLREVRNPCPDAACIEQAYAVWDAVLVARSRRLASAAASPAASLPVGPASRTAAGAPISPPVDPTAATLIKPVSPRTSVPAPALPPATAPAPALPPASARAPAPAPRPANDSSASAAATAETKPFPVDPAILADARALRGRACAPGEDVPRETGFVPVPGQLPVVSNGSVVLVRNHLDADFAVLLDTRRGACRMVDVVALPPHLHVSHLLQCTLPSGDGTAAPLSAGVGLRRPGQQAPIAYWEIDLAHGQFIRQPLGVLGWAGKLECRLPEIGD